jgi:DnaJ-class molecular chaperone
MDYKDYYSILGIPRDADEQTIKSAFRQKARVYHPDVNANKAEATEKFKEINEAYTVLSDPDKRTRYDLFNGRYDQYQRTSTGTRTGAGAGYGSASARPGYGPAGSTARASSGPSQQRQDPGRGQSQRRTHTVDEENFERIFRGFAWAYGQTAGRRGRSGSAGSDFSDFFEALFGNLWGSADQDMAREPSEVRPGRDIEVLAEISLEEAFRGATRTLTYSDGRKVEVAIPPGIDSGAKLRIRGQGERVFGRPRGDLYMTIQVQPHGHFTRDGNDLRVQVTVDHETATHSGEVPVPAMDSTVKLKIPAGTRSGQSFRLRGLGMPSVHDPSARGDLIATITVKAPAAAPGSRTEQARRTTNATRSGAKRRSAFWSQVRQALGATLAVMGLAALAAQTVLAGGTGWQLLAALAVVLLIHGVAVRSGWALAGGLLALGGAAWTASQAELLTSAMLIEQAWPLLPLAAGIMLLRHPAGQR